jgi:tryptophan synthase alpha chain
MSRIAAALARARDERRAALVAYVCAGDPSMEATIDVVRAIADRVDVLELGVPFSDPTADGPTIQRAAERALASGATLERVLAAVESIRASSSIPIVLFSYYNPIFVAGEAALVERAHRAGVDGLLIVDLPPEESGSLRAAAIARGLDYVPLVAPTTATARQDAIAELATSFVYCISTTGVTGASADLESAARAAGELGRRASRPVALGFGIRTEADVRTVAPHVDAVVVGSAIVEAMAGEGAPARVRALVERLAAGLAKTGGSQV